MPTGASIIGGLNAGTNMAMLKQQQRRDAFDMQQKKLANYESIVGNAEKSLQRFQEEMANKRAAATSPEGQQLVDDQYAELYKSVITPISRAGEKAFQQGIPVDTPVQLARLLPYQKLPDLNAQAVVAAQAAGGVKAAETQGALPGKKEFDTFQTDNDIRLAQERGRQAQITAGVPRRQNINQVTEQVSQTGAEPLEGIGRSIMADVEQSTGIVAGISKGLSSVFGQFSPGTNQRLDAAQRIKNFNQEIKFALSRNPKYPVAEMKAIQAEMLIDADAWIVDPESEARKVIIMNDSLEKWNEADRIALPRLTDDKAQEALERIGTRQTMIDLIGDVPSLDESNNEEIESLQEKVMSGTATDEENRRFIELNSQ